MMSTAHHHRSNVKAHKKHSKKPKKKIICKQTVAKRHVLSKSERINRSIQVKKRKNEKKVSQERLFSGRNAVPKMIAFICLDAEINSDSLVKLFCDAVECFQDINGPKNSFWFPNFKQKLCFLSGSQIFSVAIDQAKIADYVVFVLSGNRDVDASHEALLRAVHAQGTSTVFSIVSDISKESQKTKLKILASLSSYMSFFYPSLQKIFDASLQSDVCKLLSCIFNSTPLGIHWRDSRSYIIPTKIQDFVDKVCIEGIIRGKPLLAPCIVHIPEIGCVKMQSCTSTENTEMMIDYADGKDDSIDPWSENVIKQAIILPTNGVRIDGALHAESVDFFESSFDQNASGYQGAWLDDDSQESDAMSDMVDNIDNVDSIEMVDTIDQERDYTEYPDEIDLHPETSAKERLKKYRAVLNIRETHWDTEEYDANTPPEYNRLLQVKDWKAFQKVASKTSAGTEFQTGSKIRFVIKLDQARLSALLQSADGSSLCFYSLASQEVKYAHLIASITKNSEYQEPLPSKSALVFQIGARRFISNPLFSEFNVANNVFKYQRFLRQDGASLAHFIGPLTLSKEPIVVWRPMEGGWLQLVAQGTFLRANDCQVVVKRAVLTGQPFKIHKKLVTIRYMFYNAEDVKWFKRVPISTKQGCRGYIKQSLGEHGLFKATFNQKPKVQDTIKMCLYKRVYPKATNLDFFY